VNRFRNLPLEFTPGDQFKYSNSGYVLLAHIVERISKETFGDFLYKHVFAPLNMHNSGCDNHKTILKNRASGYEVDENRNIVNCEFIDMSIPTGGGNLYSTVEDLYLFDRGLYTDKIINTASLDLMHNSFVTSSQYNASYGYGWFIADDKFGNTSKKRIGHGGGIYGFKSEFNRYLNDDAVVIVLSNISITPKEKIAFDLAEIVLT
jgi:CubicO group peptidase (beta-lactamase class C family)